MESNRGKYCIRNGFDWESLAHINSTVGMNDRSRTRIVDEKVIGVITMSENFSKQAEKGIKKTMAATKIVTGETIRGVGYLMEPIGWGFKLVDFINGKKLGFIDRVVDEIEKTVAKELINHGSKLAEDGYHKWSLADTE